MERFAPWLPAFPIAKKIVLPLAAANPVAQPRPILTLPLRNFLDRTGCSGTASMLGMDTDPPLKMNNRGASCGVFLIPRKREKGIQHIMKAPARKVNTLLERPQTAPRK
jgi:hypothetical protein